MNLSFLLAGFCLLGFYSQIEAGSIPAAQCQPQWIVSSCEACQPTAEETVECNMISQGRYCCNRPDVISGGMGELTACQKRVLGMKAQLITACLTTPFSMMLLHAIHQASNASDPNPYDKYVCQSFEDAMDCVLGTFSTELGFGDECNIKEDFYPWIPQWMSELSALAPTIALDNTIFDKCVGYNAVAQCPDKDNVKSTLVASCVLRIMVLPSGVSSNGKCINWKSCMMEIEAAYQTTAGAFCPNIKELFTTVESEGQAEFSSLIGVKLDECSACALKTAPLWPGLTECLTVPMQLLNLSSVMDLSGNQAFLCDAYKMAMACIKFRYVTNNDLGIEDATPMCNLQNDFHPLFVEYMVTNSGVNSTLPQLYNQCTGAFSDLSVCPNQSGLKAALIGACAMAVRDLGDSNTDIKCGTLRQCVNELKSGYKKRYEEVPTCDTDGTFDSIIYDSTQMEGFKAVANFDGLQCFPCNTRVEYIKESVMECLGSPIALLNLRKHLLDASLKSMVCPAYSSAIECIRGRHDRDLGLSSGSCSIAADFHAMFLGMIKKEYDELSTEFEQEILQCTSAFTTSLECPTKEKIKEQIVYHCAGTVMDFSQTNYQDVQCVVFGDCFEKIKMAYLKDAKDCSVGLLFDEISKSSADNQEFADLTGFNPMNCSACINRVVPYADAISSCLQNANSMLKLSVHFDLTTNEAIKPFICNAYYVSIGCIKKYATQLGITDNSCSLMDDFHPLFLRWVEALSRETPGLKNQVSIFEQCTDAASIAAAGTECPDKDHARTALIIHCAGPVLVSEEQSNDVATCSVLDSCINTLKAAYMVEAKICPIDTVFDSVTSDADDIALFSKITDFPVKDCTDMPTGPDDSDLMVCSNVQQLLVEITQGKAKECLDDFTAILTASSQEDYCTKFWDAMGCAAKALVPDDYEGCLRKMHEKTQEEPAIVLTYLTENVGLDLPAQIQEFASKTDKCEKEDIDACSNIDAIYKAITEGAAISCALKIIDITATSELDVFCSKFWEAMMCVADALTKDDYEKRECVGQMKKMVDTDPSGIIDVMKRNGISVSDQTSSLARQANTCEIDGYEDDDDLSNQKPVLDALKKCGKLSEVVRSTETCDLNLVISGANCAAFKSGVSCVASNLVEAGSLTEDLYNHMMEQCIDLITVIMMRNKQMFMKRIGNFDFEKCMEQEEACGDGHKPLANVDCALTDCPNNYTCMMKSYCCPSKKPGMCPVMKASAPCVPRLKTRCTVDMDCQGTMKCCDHGCGYMTCEMTEVREKSSCELGLERAKERLYTQGACGDGTGVVGVPQCQNSLYGPIQGDVASGVMFCVDENGMKIPGSEFRGNKDCPRTRAGRCPVSPNICQVMPQENIVKTCNHDEECQDGKKCCYAETGDICVKMCVTSTDTTGTVNPMQVCPSGQERHCCPVNLIQGKVCHADQTAVPRINPCGGCTVEFYSVDNKKVNCEQGVSACQQKKAMSRMMNREMKKNYASRLKDFIEAHEEYMDDENESMDKRLDLDMDMEDLSMDDYMDEDGNDDKMADKSSMMDEYGNMARTIEQMETDERVTEISMAFQRSNSLYMESMVEMTCSFFNEHGFCQNGGTCNVGGQNTDGYLQLCQCPQGYFGLFCELSYQLTPNTRCTRYRAITNTIEESITNVGNMGSFLHGLLSIFQVDHDIMPTITCDSTGMFDEVQQGIMLPIGDMKHMVMYCVDKSTGVRKPFTRIALMDEMLDCSQIVAPDVLSLPKRCRLPPGEPCSNDSMACQYYFNPVSEKCEKSSRVGYGFDYISQCYQECGLQVVSVCPAVSPNGVGICPVCPDEGCPAGQMCCPTECGGKRCIDMVYAPQPCRNTSCNYLTEFCLVEETETGPVGRCKALKPYCMQDPDPGYGDKEIGAYYFDTTIRRCSKFTYMGQGGNTNRFYNLHQCQTECGVYADYKFSGPVCPIPSMVHKPSDNPVRVDMCNGDYDCIGNLVCCSNGYAKVCVYPVGVCGTQRCSPEAKCVSDKCICPTCEETTGDKVCGSNGMEYRNLCMLKKHACETMMNITVAPCNTIPPAPSCPMACTMQYMPVCAYGDNVLKTFSNLCMMMQEITCNGKMYNILYTGECAKRECEGTTCELYEACVDGECVCPSCGVSGDPICGHSDGLEEVKMTFGSMCEMRRYGCLTKQLFVVYSLEPCKKPEPTLECPATRRDIVHSAVRLCHPGTDAYCGKDSKCCPYGAGYRCIPMKYMVEKKIHKPGFCPIQSYVNFNRKNCFNKAYMCTDDSDAPGNSKCCENLVCGHKTIALPLGLANENVCGDNRTVVRGMMCDLTPGATSVCPSGSTCTGVMSAQWTMGVCCQPRDGPEPTDMDVYGNRLCKAVSDLGLMPICQNDGTCVGNVHDAKMCECPVGFVGAFCERTLRPYENPCTASDVQCLRNPCDNKTCHIEGAVCKADYCGACTARWSLGDQDVTEECAVTKCERLREIMSKVFSLLPDEEDAMPSRRRRGVPTNTNVDGESEDNGMTNIFTAFNVNQLSMVMQDLKYTYVPEMGQVVCEMDGLFSQKQCYQHVSEGEKQFCTCVDSRTGMRIKNAPKAPNKEALDCSFVTAADFPQFCKEVPSMAMCSDIEQERYYFSLEHGDCVSYMEMGCNDVKFENSFSNYNSCRSVCSHRSVTPSECATLKCASGTECKKIMGVVGCYSVTSVMATHDYPEPTCDMNGDYSPRQCQGNLCYCVNKDGTPVPNSFGDGQNLVCNRDGNGMTTAENVQTTQRKQCANGATIKVCDGPGDPCNNCEMRQSNNNNNNNNNMNMVRDPNVDDDGTCKNCQTCPSGQGMMTCAVSCDTMPVCAQFPQAVCKVDPCTCTANYYKSNNKVVNCNAVCYESNNGDDISDAAQSRCEREKTELEKRLLTEAFQMRLNNAMNSETLTLVALKCADDGSYFARCVGDVCHCLNAASGETSGDRKTAVTLATIDDIDCSVTQRKTAPKQITIRAKISNKRLEQIPPATQTKIKETYKDKIERENKVRVIMIELIAGSVLIDVTTEFDSSSSVVSDTEDLASIASNVQSDLQEAVEIDGEVFIGTETSIREMLTEEDLVQTTTAVPTKDDEANTGLIIGVVIGGVALLLIIIVAIVLFNRSNKKKSSSMRFSDIQGKENPTYKY